MTSSLERLAARAARSGSATRSIPATEMGPVAFEGHMEKVLSAIGSAQAEGATSGHGRRPAGCARVSSSSRRSSATSPTAWTSPATRSSAPVLAALCGSPGTRRRRSALANATEFGLAAGVWTRDVQRAHPDGARAGPRIWVNAYRAVGGALASRAAARWQAAPGIDAAGATPRAGAGVRAASSVWTSRCHRGPGENGRAAGDVAEFTELKTSCSTSRLSDGSGPSRAGRRVPVRLTRVLAIVVRRATFVVEATFTRGRGLPSSRSARSTSRHPCDGSVSAHGAGGARSAPCRRLRSTRLPWPDLASSSSGARDDVPPLRRPEAAAARASRR